MMSLKFAEDLPAIKEQSKVTHGWAHNESDSDAAEMPELMESCESDNETQCLGDQNISRH